MEETIKEFLRDRIAELTEYAEDESNGYDDCERHDCLIAADVYEDILAFIENQNCNLWREHG